MSAAWVGEKSSRVAGLRGGWIEGDDRDDECDQIVFFRPDSGAACVLGGMQRNGLMQSVRERPSDPWIGMIGWVGIWCWIRSVDCGWLEEGRGYLARQ